jgi:hypothetical protein
MKRFACYMVASGRMLIAGALVPLAAGLVHQARAQDSQSAVGFLVSEASRQAPQQPPTPVVPLLLNEGRYSPERQRAVTALKKMPTAKTRFVRLLEADEGKVTVPPPSKAVREPILDAAGASQGCVVGSHPAPWRHRHVPGRPKGVRRHDRQLA